MCMKNLFFGLGIAVLLLSSCVTAKKYDEQTALAHKYWTEKKDCEETLTKTEANLEKSSSDLAKLKEEKTSLLNDLATISKSKENLSKLADEERMLKEKTNKEYESYMQSSSAKQEKLTQALADKERELNKRETDLLNAQKNLEDREAMLVEIKKEIFDKELAVQEKTKRIEELESKLNAQSEAMSALKNSIKKALKDFTSDELTVEEKEGKIYVSLSEKLLFKPGSFTLDQAGESAIAKLAVVLEKQNDVDIIVEGHTDSDAYSGSGALQDNLDLSTKRATTVARVLIKNKVPKEKIVASGRGDSKPVAENTSKEGKAKNRRTEIILSPNIEKLLELIQSK